MTPDGWERHAIGDLLDSCTYGISSRLSTEPEGTPILRMGNIADHRLDLADLKYADLSDKDPSDTLLRQGDVLFNRTNSADKVGKVALVDTDRPLGFASYLLRLRPNDSATPEWLYYLLSSPALQRRLRSLATRGVSQVNINPTRMRALQVAVPPLREQHKIAATLSSVDEVIGKTEAVIAQLQVVKSAMLHELLTRGLPGRHTRFKQTEIGEIPEDWNVVPLAAVLESGPTNGRSPKASEQPPGVPTFSIAAVRDGVVNIANNLKYANVDPPSVSAFHVKVGDVLIVRGNGNPDLMGRAGQVHDVPVQGCIYPDILMRVRNNDTIVSSLLVPLWNSDVVHDQLLLKAKTTNGTYKINGRDVSSTLLPIPPLGEQERIVSAVEALDGQLAAERTVLARLQTTKSAAMSALLTGEVRVPLDEEAA